VPYEGEGMNYFDEEFGVSIVLFPGILPKHTIFTELSRKILPEEVNYAAGQDCSIRHE
jgi:hypothetical protein